MSFFKKLFGCKCRENCECGDKCCKKIEKEEVKENVEVKDEQVSTQPEVNNTQM